MPGSSGKIILRSPKPACEEDLASVVCHSVQCPIGAWQMSDALTRDFSVATATGVLGGVPGGLAGGGGGVFGGVPGGVDGGVFGGVFGGCILSISGPTAPIASQIAILMTGFVASTSGSVSYTHLTLPTKRIV